MRNLEELFLDAVNAYKAWINTGKDFVNHADLYDSWDDAVNAYADQAMLRRNQAVSHVVQALGVLK
jgi:hypothetical protein